MPRGWETGVAIIAAIGMGMFMPSASMISITAEVITVTAAIMAALIPAMILAATALRAGAFNETDLRKLSIALSKQIDVFGGLFLYGLTTCSLLLAGRSVGWVGPSTETGWTFLPVISVGWCLMTIATFGVILLVCRSVAVIAGIRSILALATDIALAEARLRDAQRPQPSDLEGYQSPEGYGRLQELQH